MGIILQLLWAAMMLLFLFGAVAYAFKPNFGIDLLKRAGVLCVLLLIAPNVIHSVLDAVPLWLLVMIGVAASFAAYHHLSRSAEKRKQGTTHVAHAERKPQLPHQEHDHQ